MTIEQPGGGRKQPGHVIADIELFADTTMFGMAVVEFYAEGDLQVDAETSTPPYDSSTPHGHRPRHAVLAATSSQKKHQAAVKHAARSIAMRQRLPLTQVGFYAQRSQRRR